MNTDKLKLFRNEEEVRSYARVNGQDEAGVNRMVAQWKSATAEKELVKGSKRFGFMKTDVIETKD